MVNCPRTIQRSNKQVKLEPFCLAQCNAISVPFCHVRMIYIETGVVGPFLMNGHHFVFIFALLKVKEQETFPVTCCVSCSALLYVEFKGCSGLYSEWSENVPCD